MTKARSSSSPARTCPRRASGYVSTETGKLNAAAFTAAFAKAEAAKQERFYFDVRNGNELVLEEGVWVPRDPKPGNEGGKKIARGARQYVGYNASGKTVGLQEELVGNLPDSSIKYKVAKRFIRRDKLSNFLRAAMDATCQVAARQQAAADQQL
jgi:hypothetical protein